MTATERVEAQAIAIAEKYASSNGAPRAAAGLMLAGMAIAALASPAAQRLLAQGYLAAHPGARDRVERWAAALTKAVDD